MLLARRLCEAGTGFVTIHYGGWDMHGNIAGALKGRCPQMDQAVAAFVLGDIAISFEVFQFDPARNTFLTDPV